jgi:hypothetical protein
MTDEQSPFLMPLDFVCNPLQIPYGISAMAFPKVTLIIDEFNHSLFRSRTYIEAVTLTLPGRKGRFLDTASLLFDELADAIEKASNSVEVVCSKAVMALSILKNEVLDQDTEKIDLLLAEMELYRINIFSIDFAAKPNVSGGTILGKNT